MAGSGLEGYSQEKEAPPGASPELGTARPSKAPQTGEDDSHASPSPRHSVSATGPHLLNKPTLRETSADIILEDAHGPDLPNGADRRPAPAGTSQGHIAVTTVPTASAPAPAEIGINAVRPPYASRPLPNNVGDWVGHVPGSKGEPASVDPQPTLSRARYSSSQLEPMGTDSVASSKSYHSMLTRENLENLAQLDRAVPKSDPNVGVGSKPGTAPLGVAQLDRLHDPRRSASEGPVGRWCNWLFCCGHRRD